MEIEGYKIFCKDRNKHGSGTIFSIKENIPYRELTFNNLQKEIDAISLEFSLRNRNWLCIGLYKHPN